MAQTSQSSDPTSYTVQKFCKWPESSWITFLTKNWYREQSLALHTGSQLLRQINTIRQVLICWFFQNKSFETSNLWKVINLDWPRAKNKKQNSPQVLECQNSISLTTSSNLETWQEQASSSYYIYTWWCLKRNNKFTERGISLEFMANLSFLDAAGYLHIGLWPFSLHTVKTSYLHCT